MSNLVTLDRTAESRSRAQVPLAQPARLEFAARCMRLLRSTSNRRAFLGKKPAGPRSTAMRQTPGIEGTLTKDRNRCKADLGRETVSGYKGPFGDSHSPPRSRLRKHISNPSANER